MTVVTAIIIVVMVIMVSIVSNKHGYDNDIRSLLSVYVDRIVRVIMIAIMFKSNHYCGKYESRSSLSMIRPSIACCAD